MFGMSMWEILVVLGLLFIVVGPGKLPGLAKKLGEQIRGLKQSLADVKSTVDADDEFVKAVGEARQSVAEAKDAVRGILDDVVNVTEDLGLDEAARDPAPRPVAKGRKRVSRSKRGSKRRDRDRGGRGPALAEEPVEAEDWRAGAQGRDGQDDAPAPVDDTDDVDDTDGAADAVAGVTEVVEPEDVSETNDVRGVPGRPVRRGATTGRRMIRPGRSRTGDEE